MPTSKISKYMLERMPDRMPKYVPTKMPDRTSEYMPKIMSDIMSNIYVCRIFFLDRMPKTISEQCARPGIVKNNVCKKKHWRWWIYVARCIVWSCHRRIVASIWGANRSAWPHDVGRFVFVRLVAANTQCLEFMCCAAPFRTGDVHIQLLFQVLVFTFCCMLLLFSSMFGRSLSCDCRCCRQKFVRPNQFTTPSLNSSLSFAGLVSLMFL